MAEEEKNINLPPDADNVVKTAEENSTVAPQKKQLKSKTKAKSKGRKKRASRRQVTQGRAYIKSTYNNTIVTLTDQNGNTIAWSSAGLCGFRGPKKATPYAAGVIVKRAVEQSLSYGLKEVSVFVRGIGMAREAAIRALNANGINVISIKDTTPIPHNGCRLKKPRRV